MLHNQKMMFWITNCCQTVFKQLTFLSLLLTAITANAMSPEQKVTLATGEYEARVEILNGLVSQSDVSALPFLQYMLDDAVKFKEQKIWIVKDDAIYDGVTDKPASLPEDAEDVVNNGLMQSELEATMATLHLLSSDVGQRKEAAEALKSAEPSAARLAAVRAVLLKEQDADIKVTLDMIVAAMALAAGEKAERLSALEKLSANTDTATRQLLASRLEEGGETDKEVQAAIKSTLKKIEQKLSIYEYLGQAFTGISLGSILLLAALGLAITYGLMGVINMAHGEMMMIGAYATFIVQNMFIRYMPDFFQWYIVVAIPVAFLVSAIVGIILERTVLRFLYGRPLETLLATWGVSLILMQAVRTLFGAQNVQVENPAWMSGGFEVASNLVLPYNRLMIIVFAIMVLVMMWLMISKTRLGLYIRAVTQNRQMASCTGVNTSKIDAMAFGLGSGIAGLAGVALSQIGNVGPALGQSYIVDSFMVVVLGGVGQLAGTVYAAMGLGVLSKLFEGLAGAVLAKIIILVIVIVFIQKRPQGLFAFKGRQID